MPPKGSNKIAFKSEQRKALGLLKQAREEGNLDPSIEPDIFELIGEKIRPEVGNVVEESDEALDKSNKEERFFIALNERFMKQPDHFKRPEGVNFKEIRNILKKRPDLLRSLMKMEETGGEPDVIKIEDDSYIFADCSEESPDRRNLSYPEAVEMADHFGLDLMDPNTYKELHKIGIFDISSVSWLFNPEFKKGKGGNRPYKGKRETGYKWIANFPTIVQIPAHADYIDGHRYTPKTVGWRGILRVPRNVN